MLPRFQAARALILAALCTRPAAAESRPGYGGVAIGPLGSSVNTVDPARATRVAEIEVASLVFDAPFVVDALGRVQPRLAVALETVDPTHARIVLRPGWKFHDGQSLTAADVAASLERAAKLPAGWTLAPIRAARAVSDEVVELDLQRPSPDLALLLASSAASVTPGGLAPTQKVIGSGPFRFSGWDRKVVRLAANPLYADGRPYLDALSLRFYGSRVEEAGSFEVGSSQVSLHGATAFEGGAPKHKTAVLDGPRSLTMALVFGKGSEHGLPDDPALKRAIAGAIDRERLRRLAVRDSSEAARVALDPARARSDLLRLGAGGRWKASLVIDASRFDDRDVADKLQAELSELGIDLTVEPVDAKPLGERIESGRFDLALVETGGGPDPGMAALTQLAAVDPRLARALLLRGPADAATVEKAVAERVLFTPLYHRSVRLHHRADLAGLVIDAAGRVDYASAHWVK